MLTDQKDKDRFDLEMQIILDYIRSYNSIGYGECTVWETPTRFVLHFWNAGYSENEELDQEFSNYVHEMGDKLNLATLIYNMHPNSIYIIQKSYCRESKHNRIIITHDYNWKPLKSVATKTELFAFPIEID